MAEYCLIKINNHLLRLSMEKSELTFLNRDEELSYKFNMLYEGKMQEAELLYITDNKENFSSQIEIKKNENIDLFEMANFDFEPADVVSELKELKSKIVELENENSNLKTENSKLKDELRFLNVAFYDDVDVNIIEDAYVLRYDKYDKRVIKISANLIDESIRELEFYKNIREIFKSIFSTYTLIQLCINTNVQLENETKRVLELLVKFKINVHNRYITEHNREYFEKLIKIDNVDQIFMTVKSLFNDLKADTKYLIDNLYFHIDELKLKRQIKN